MKRALKWLALIVIGLPFTLYLILVVLGGGWGAKEPLPEVLAGNRPIFFAHRGAVGAYPENSIGALKVAEQLGFRAVEIDLQFHPDGQFILSHDYTTDRLLGIPGTIADHTIEQLQNLPLQNADTATTECTPTLQQVIDTLNTAKLYYLDTKHNTDLGDFDLARRMRDFIRENDLYDRAIVASSHFVYIAALEYYDPRIVTCFEGLNPSHIWFYNLIPRGFKSDILGSRWAKVTPEYIDWLSDNGLLSRYLTYHVDDKTMVEALQQGVELLIVDYTPVLDSRLRRAGAGGRY